MIQEFNLFDRSLTSNACERPFPLLENDEFGQVWQVSTPDGARGYCVIGWSYSLESGGRECLVDEIFVANQSRGLGTLLLEGAIEGARRGGVNVVFLETEVHNERVRSFYQRHGFQIEDSIWMRRVL